MIGNGIRYALMISLDVRRDVKGRFLVSKITVPDSVVDFISSVPVCTGVNVKHDIENVEYYYSLFSKKKLRMKGRKAKMNGLYGFYFF